MALVSPVKKFTKGRGTTNVGDDFEELLAALFAFRLCTNEKSENFHLSCNNPAFGLFDDVVLDIISNSTSCQYAIQIKHRQNSAFKITTDMLAGSEKDFNILRYFHSYSILRTNSILQNNCKCLLFTNATLGYIQRFTLMWKRKLIYVRVRKEFLPEEDLFWNTSQNKYVYTFDFREQNGSVCLELQEFSKNFLLCVNQQSYEELKLSVSKEFELTYPQKHFCNKYLEFISEWNNVQNEKECLNKKSVSIKVGEILLRPLMKNSGITTLKFALLQEISTYYDIIVLGGNSEIDLEAVYKDLINSWAEDILKMGKEMYILPYGTRDLSRSEFKDRAIILWHMNKIPLFIDLQLDDHNGETVCKAIHLFEKNERKFVLCAENFARNRFSKFRIFENLKDLPSNSKLYKKVVQNTKVSIQGRDEILLQDDKELQTILSCDELLKNNCINIGETTKESLPAHYIDQFFEKCYIDFEFVNENKFQSLSIISCNGKFKKVEHRLKSKTMTIEEFLSTDLADIKQHLQDNVVVLSETQCSRKQFEDVCKKSNTFCHLFIVDLHLNLEWVRSNGGMEQLQDFKRIDDEFKDSEIFSSSNQQINVICAKPGAGKSVMLKYLKNNILSNYWIVHTSLTEHLSFLQESRSSFADHLLSFQAKKLNFDYLTLQVRDIFKTNRKIVFLLDALDELPSCLEVAVDKILELSEEGFICWVTARHFLLPVVENKLHVLPLNIKEIAQAQQETYIRQRLQAGHNSEVLNVIVKKITEMVKLARDLGFMGIALNIYILTELFLRNPQKYMDLLDSKFTLADMIRHFVEETFLFCSEDKGKLVNQNPFVQKMFKQHIKYKLQEYEMLAIKTFFPQEISNDLNCQMLDDISEYKDDFGVITEIDSKSGMASFAHTTYGEYFAASWMASNPMFVKKIAGLIFEENYRNIRIIYDLILTKDCPAHLAVLLKDYESLGKLKEGAKRDKGGRTLLHLACSWGQKHPLLDPYLLESTDVSNDSTDSDVTYDSSEEDTDSCESSDANIFAKDFTGVINISEDSADSDATLNTSEDDTDPHEGADMNISSGDLPGGVDSDVTKNPLGADMYLHEGGNENTVSGDRDETNDSNQEADPETAWVLNSCGKLNFVKEEDDKYKNILHYLITNLKCDPFESDHLFQWNCLEYADHSLSLFALEAVAKSHYFRMEDLENFSDLRSVPVYCVKFNYESIFNLLPTIDYIIINRTARENLLHFSVKCQQSHFLEKILTNPLYVSKIDEPVKEPNFLMFTTRRTSLHLAALQGNEEIIEKLIARGSQINLSDSNENTALHLALNNKNSNVLSMLLTNGADVNLKNNIRSTPLHIVSPWGDVDVLKKVLERGAYISKNWLEQSPASLAAAHNTPEALDLVLEKGIYQKLSIDDCMYGALLAAIKNSRIENLKYLLRRKVNVNKVVPGLAPPFCFAVICGHFNVIQFLLDNGADINIKDSRGKNSLLYAIVNSQLQITEFLLHNNVEVENGNGNMCLVAAIVLNNIELVQLLLDYNVNVNAKNEDGESPLHFAAVKANTRIIKLLLEKNAEVNLENKYEETALHYAAALGETEVVKLLTDQNANINLRNRKGFSSKMILNKPEDERKCSVSDLINCFDRLEISSYL